MNHLLLFMLIPFSQCFNISPTPSFILQNPTNRARSSYFGYSILLRKNSVLIGAPRSQTVKETGAVFRCDFNSKSNSCRPQNFADEFIDMSQYDQEYQLLGASIDGGESENDPYVACAPLMKISQPKLRMTGGCYHVKPNNDVFKLTPFMDNSTNNAETGFSVHIPPNKTEIVCGTPGWNPHHSRETHFGNVVRFGTKSNSEFKSKNNDQMIKPNSYFGYSLTTGYFEGSKENNSYVTGAPRIDNLKGAVFKFKIKNSVNIIEKTFKGTQMGEYFGYAVVAEDFNNDGLDDLAISAPFYNSNKEQENGRVLVYISEGNMNFKKPKIITSEYEFSGRFGTAMSKIGDINLDGYNDIAISAPFEGNGVVYIYLGGPNGILATNPKLSQRIEAPKISSPTKVPQMFGFSLSKGVDIDSNGYRDLAIGSPNSEQVYIYKTYPMIKVNCEIISSKTNLKQTDQDLNVKLCFSMDHIKKTNIPIGLDITFILDANTNQKFFSIFKTSQYSIQLFSNKKTCKDFKVDFDLSSADLTQSIKLQAKWKTQKDAMNQKTFCDTCVVIDPLSKQSTSKDIYFATNCKEHVCSPDLSIKGSLQNVIQPYIIGSISPITIKYNVTNNGELASFIRVSVTIPENITRYLSIPSQCNEENDKQTLTCSLRNLQNKQRSSVEISLDTSRLEGDSFKVLANVTSAEIDKKSVDNKNETIVTLKKFSIIKVVGTSNPVRLLTTDESSLEEVKFMYEIKNNGPTAIENLIVYVQIPLSIEINEKKISIVDQAKVNLQLSQSKEKDETFKTIKTKVLPETIKNPKVKILEDEITRNLPMENTIFLDCLKNEKSVKCRQAKFTIPFIKTNDEVKLELIVPIDLSQIHGMLDVNLNASVYALNLILQRAGDEEFKTTKVSLFNPSTVISKGVLETAPMWFYILAIALGCLFLVGLAYALHKLGFFKRSKKDDLMMLKEEIYLNNEMTVLE